MNFRDEMKRTLGDEFNYGVTENGALGYRTTQNALVDLNFQVSSLRYLSENEIFKKFLLAFYEDKLHAMKWLFFLRDVRGGLGERRAFRVILNSLAITHPELVMKVLPIIAEYGRWDDLLQLVNYTNPLLQQKIKSIVVNTLSDDLTAMRDNKPCSLLAKWMPSANSKNPKVRKDAQVWVNTLYGSIPNRSARERHYRKVITSLRKYLDVVECKMVAQQWDQIRYESVPSKANLRYRNAFLRHDEKRRTEFLDSANKGNAKMNSSTAFPHDIVHQYGRRTHILSSTDPSLEAMWKNLPNTINNQEDNVLVVRDGSGSMSWQKLSNTSVTALEIATALAIYFSERITGQFKDNFITFSSKPKLVNLSGLGSLHDKLIKTYAEDDCSNTNIEAVFNLILTTANRTHMSQEEMPSTILILSDMEFDAGSHNLNERLFKSIETAYECAGYKLPRLVFWNICSRTETIPVKENEMGVALISGFSTNLAKMVMSNQTDPYKVLLETLDSPRYSIIEKLLSE